MKPVTDDEKLLIYKKRIRELIDKWTEKAQSSYSTDDERTIYYQCAEELHNIH